MKARLVQNSDKIQELLERLHGEFKTKLEEVQTNEKNSAHNHNLFMIELDHDIKSCYEFIDTAKEKSSVAAAEGAEAKRLATETEKALHDSNEGLKALRNENRITKATFQENQDLMTGEIKALAEAIKILSGKELTAGVKHIDLGLAQQPSFLQVSSQFMSPEARSNVFIQKAGDILRKANSGKLKDESQHVAFVLAQMMAGSPFEKIIKMLEDMLAKLRQEAEDETTHHQWCTEELERTEKAIKKHTHLIGSLNANLEKEQSQLEQTQADMKKNTASVSETTKEMLAQREDNEAAIKKQQRKGIDYCY